MTVLTKDNGVDSSYFRHSLNLSFTWTGCPSPPKKTKESKLFYFLTHSWEDSRKIGSMTSQMAFHNG